MRMDYNLTQDIPKVSIGEFSLKHLRKNALNGNKIAQIFADDGSSMSYKELYMASVYVAAGSKEMGLKSGDFVSIVSRNSHELFPTILGCVMVGAVLVPSVVELSASELRSNFIITKPKIILTTQVKRSTVEEAVTGLSPKPKVFDVFDFFKEAVSRGSQTDLEKFEPFKVADPETHTCVCLFSSGTTGPQKAVARTDYYSFIKSAYSASALQIQDGSFLYINQPNFGTWWAALFTSFFYNRTRIFVSKLDFESIANAIHKYRPTIWNFAHPDKLAGLQKLLEQNPGKWDISSLKVIECVSDILRPEIHDDLQKKFGIPIYHEYGSTEAGVPFKIDFDSPPVVGSVGKPQRNVKLVDPDTREEIKEPNQPGELLVFGGCATYLNNPEATKNAYEDGWYKTGDLFYFDNDGYYFVVGRLKEMFKCKTYQVTPQEIETYIRLIPGVAETVVVGKRVDVTIGEVPTAFVVRAPNSKITEQDILDHLEKLNLHDSKKLRGGVIFIDSIPRNENNKILRRKLQEIVNKERGRDNEERKPRPLLQPESVFNNYDGLSKNFADDWTSKTYRELYRDTVLVAMVHPTVDDKIPIVEGAVSELNPKVLETLGFFKDAIHRGPKSDMKNFVPVLVKNLEIHDSGCLFSSGTTETQKAVIRTDIFGFLKLPFMQR